MKCFIFSSYVISDYSFLETYDFNNAFIIAADGGYRHPLKLGHVPHAVIGDMDSLDIQISPDSEIIKYPPEKDKTDTHIAIEYAVSQGFTDITLFGAVGGRIDHTLANTFLIKKFVKLGIDLKIVNEKNEIHGLYGRVGSRVKFEIAECHRKYISLIPLTEKVTGVTTNGLKYPLSDAVLYMEDSFAVSNEIDSVWVKPSEISPYVEMEDGFLLICLTDD